MEKEGDSLKGSSWVGNQKRKYSRTGRDKTQKRKYSFFGLLELEKERHRAEVKRDQEVSLEHAAKRTRRPCEGSRPLYLDSTAFETFPATLPLDPWTLGCTLRRERDDP